MNKQSTLLLALLFGTATLLAQGTKKQTDNNVAIFRSNTGTITACVDTKLPNLKTNIGEVETKIRKITNGVTSIYFYQLTQEEQFCNTTVSIEYNDLVEIIKAFKNLFPEVEKVIALNEDYWHNIAATVPGIEVGCYIKKTKAYWFIKLEKNDLAYVGNVTTIETAFMEAKNKIDELKK